MSDASDVALLLVRVVIGLTLAAHGVNKAKSLAGTAGWFDSIGMRPGRVHARLAAGGEIVAGCLPRARAADVVRRTRLRRADDRGVVHLASRRTGSSSSRRAGST